ncbi:MAG: dynamin family protein [Acidobacteriota bacterium]|nr:dynamin family protein [Acidobacteriota bacterium]
MLNSLLTPAQQELLAREREVLRSLQVTLAESVAEDTDIETLEHSLFQLDHLFLLVVVGEFNSGKSTFINALLGRELLEQGVTPTTSRIHRLRYSETEESKVDEDGVVQIAAPIELLRQVEIVDTPGTNALDRQHEIITRDFVPRSDLVLFVTSADRPFSESERVFMDSIRTWGKKLVLVLNKIDFLAAVDDVYQVQEFISDRAAALLDFVPEIFPVSAQKGLAAKLAGGDPTLAAESRFFDLERYLVRILHDERLRLKLSNPLGVGLRLARQYGDAMTARLDLLHTDFETLEEVDLQLGLYQDDMSREFRFRLSDVDGELQAFEKRGSDYFDDAFRLARAVDLMNKERVQAEFSRRVVADTPQNIERKVGEIVDWMISSELGLWKDVAKRIEARRTEHSQRHVGEIGTFHYDREQLLATVGRAAAEAVNGFDQHREAARLADSVRTAVAGTALMEVGALSLGAVITVMATTQFADFTGILAAGTLALLGFFVLPARKRRAKKELGEKILTLRTQLMHTLTSQFDHEIERSTHRIQGAVSPYTRFVRAERQRLTVKEQRLGDCRKKLEGLAAEIERL